jgi:hypothetical protein
MTACMRIRHVSSPEERRTVLVLAPQTAYEEACIWAVKAATLA